MNTKLKNNLKRNIARSLAVATIAISAAGSFAAPADAAQLIDYGPKLGNLFMSIPNGNMTDTPTMNTDAPCPTGSGRVYATISHDDTLGTADPKNTWTDVTLWSPNTIGASQTAPMVVPILDSIFGTANSNTLNLPNGDYNVRVRCQTTSLSTIGTGYFEQNITVSNTLAPAVNQLATYTSPARPAAVAPTVTATASPSTFIQGTTTTLSARVAQPVGAAGGVPKGKVEFFAGGTSLGAATSLDAMGGASLTNSTLAAGAHSITAVYSGDAFYYTPLTSAPVSVVVTAAPATTTTTTIAATINGANVTSPANGSTTDNVTLTGRVSPASSVGTCQYFDGASSLGVVAPIDNGVCPAKDLGQLLAKSYDFTVKFVPTDVTRFVASDSGIFVVNAVASSIAPAVETINVTVAAGALTISLKGTDSQVTMSTPVLTSDARMLESTGTMKTVTVTDTRAGNPGWVAKGQVTNFQGRVPANTNKIIRGNNLGWTPKLGTISPSQTITAGPPIPSPAPPIDAAGAASTAGIFVPAVLATALANFGTGTADLDADLTLNVPTNTVAGHYSATLTLTVA